MTAKEYLNQLRSLRLKTENKIKQCNSLRENLQFLKGIDYTRDKVQTSACDQLTETMVKLLDLERETIELIDRYNVMYNEGVSRINSLSKHEYTKILTLRYLEDDKDKRKFESIACTINYSYVRTCHMHGEALQEFEKRYLKS